MHSYTGCQNGEHLWSLLSFDDLFASWGADIGLEAPCSDFRFIGMSSVKSTLSDLYAISRNSGMEMGVYFVGSGLGDVAATPYFTSGLPTSITPATYLKAYTPDAVAVGHTHPPIIDVTLLGQGMTVLPGLSQGDKDFADNFGLPVLAVDDSRFWEKDPNGKVHSCKR
jgi:hypothetical protein